MEDGSSLQLNNTPNVKYTNSESATTQHLLEIVAFGFVLLLSTLLNVALVGLGLLKKITLTPEAESLIVALCLLLAFDSLVSISFALAFLSFWLDEEPPEFVCRLSASFYYLFLASHPSYVVAHFVHLLIRRKKTVAELRVNIHLVNLLFPLVLAAIFALPILILPFLVNVQPYRSRFACGIAADSWPLTAVAILFHLLPIWGTLVCCLVLRLVRRRSPILASASVSPESSTADDGFSHLTPLAVAAVFLLLPAATTFAAAAFEQDENRLTDQIAGWSRLLFNVICPIVVFASFTGARFEFRRILSSVSRPLTPVESSFRESKNRVSDGGPVLLVASDGLVLRRNGQSPTLMRRCDLMDDSAALSSPSPQFQQLQPTSSSSFKKIRKNGKRKVVRFAQTVKEIPLDT